MTDGSTATVDDENSGAPPARYELREQLATTGVGATWRAWDRAKGREVEIRQLRPPAQLAPEQRRAMVARRARSALRAQRVGAVPGVVPVLDVLASDDEVLVVTALATGDVLADAMREQPGMPSDRAASIAAKLAATLEALHAQGLAHGDLRPSRVRVDGDAIRLVTHGLAKPDEDEPEATLLASPAYLSPQRAAGGRTGPADDVWALGVLMYAMVEGAPPFTGHSVDELLRAVAEQPAPRAVRADPQLADLIASMLDKDPGRRPTIAEVRQQLEPSPASTAEPTAAGADIETSAETPARSRSNERPRPLRDRPLLIPGLGIVVLLLICWYLLSRF
jgi:serine/threonine protein kinase